MLLNIPERESALAAEPSPGLGPVRGLNFKNICPPCLRSRAHSCLQERRELACHELLKHWRSPVRPYPVTPSSVVTSTKRCPSPSSPKAARVPVRCERVADRANEFSVALSGLAPCSVLGTRNHHGCSHDSRQFREGVPASQSLPQSPPPLFSIPAPFLTVCTCLEIRNHRQPLSGAKNV